MMFRGPSMALAGVLCAALAAGPAAGQEVEVLATIGMLGDAAAELAGDCATVTTLMGPGVDPHLYQAGARDVHRLQGADLILYSGLGLEGQLGSVLDRLGRSRATLAVAETALPEDRILRTEDAYGVDPHVWMDAGLWALTVPVLARALAEQAPDCADPIAARAQDYGDALLALDGWIAAAVASVPEERRALVTAHDAFGYYGRAYGIEVLGIQGISTEAEASVADIRETAALLVERGVPAVFVESTVNPRTVQAVIEAAGRAGHAVAIGGELYSDAMGEPGTAAGTYIGMLHHNTVEIVTALGGELPPLPGALGDWARRWGID